MTTLNLKPTHQAVRAYYDELRTLSNLDFYTEGSVSPPLPASCATAPIRAASPWWSNTLSKNRRILRLDGALLDEFRLAHGYWEAKDTGRPRKGDRRSSRPATPATTSSSRPRTGPSSTRTAGIF